LRRYSSTDYMGFSAANSLCKSLLLILTYCTRSLPDVRAAVERWEGGAKQLQPGSEGWVAERVKNGLLQESLHGLWPLALQLSAMAEVLQTAAPMEQTRVSASLPLAPPEALLEEELLSAAVAKVEHYSRWQAWVQRPEEGGLGLGCVWHCKPLMDGKDIMKALPPGTRGGPGIGILKSMAREWQFARPEACAARGTDAPPAELMAQLRTYVTAEFAKLPADAMKTRGKAPAKR